MTEYERVVFLDSNVLVVSNMDHLFRCGTFCAAIRHSDYFNSGVMVIEPSTAVFNDMLKKVPVLPSYDGGDQGFLNQYFKDFIYAAFFNVSHLRKQHQPMRIPSGFNADIGQYYCLSKWLIPKKEMWAMHMDLWKLQPWVWWQNRLLDLNWKWTSVRKRLPCHVYGDHTAEFLLWPGFWAPYPFALLLFLGLRCFSHWVDGGDKIRHFDAFNRQFSHLLPLPVLCVSYLLALVYMVPTSMLPSQAEFVFWLWSSFFVLLFLGTYCCLCHLASKLQQASTSQNVTKKLLRTLLLFLVFTVSHLFQAFLPLAIAVFYKRVRVFLVLSVIHLVVSQVTGHAVIRVWSKPCLVHGYRSEHLKSIRNSAVF